jgi:uncharacterized membrane protein YqjE
VAKGSDSRPGVVRSVRSLVSGLFEVLEQRTQLLSIEVRQEKRRLFGDLARVAALAICASMTVVSVNVALFVWLWEHRFVLSVVLVLVYGLSALALFASIRRRMRLASPPFEATIGELRKDRAAMGRS